MKGYTTLQLIDPKRDRVVKELKREENYLTDLYQTIYNKLAKPWLGGSPLDLFLGSKFSYWTLGVLLFPTALPAQGNGCMWPRITDVPTGYGSTDAYSGTDMKRGAFNSVESINLSNPTGIRKVWDFGTGRAVGDVACVALTTTLGGQADFANPTAFTAQLAQSPSGQVYQGTSLPGFDYTYGCLVFLTDKYIITEPYGVTSISLSANTKIFKRNREQAVSYPRALRFSPTDTPEISVAWQSTPSGYTRCGRPFIIGDYLYILYYKTTVTKAINVDKYDLTTGAYISTTTYTFDFQASSISSWWMNDTYICWTDNSKLYVAGIATLTVTSYSYSVLGCSTIYSICNTEFDNIVMVGGAIGNTTYGGKVVYFDLVNKNVVRSYLVQYCYGTTDNYSSSCQFYMEPPLVYNSQIRNNSSNVTGIAVITNSLATINNLSQTITKPTDKVLKVIYDLTW